MGLSSHHPTRLVLFQYHSVEIIMTEKTKIKLDKVRKVEKKKGGVGELTDEEREAVTIVFHQFETGLREGTIFTKDALDAMKALGLNPGEQEMIDMTNEVNNNGLIFYPDFCKLVLRKYREESKEILNQALFKVICGTDPYPQNFRAKKWKIKDKFFTKADFQFMMRNLPVPVEEEEIEAMFEFADKDKDGKINYRQGKNSRPKNKSNLNAIHSNLSVTHSLMIYKFSLHCPFRQS